MVYFHEIWKWKLQSIWWNLHFHEIRKKKVSRESGEFFFFTLSRNAHFLRGCSVEQKTRSENRLKTDWTKLMLRLIVNRLLRTTFNLFVLDINTQEFVVFIDAFATHSYQNKTISDGGITVDFSIIKVHTSNWSSNSWGSSNTWGSSNSSCWDHRIVGDHRIPLDL